MNLDYVAGFIDGEGCISFTRNKSGCLLPRIIITNTNQAILETFHKKFGGSLRVRTLKDKPHWKPMWSWSLANRQAITLLSKIVSKLRIKQNQAILVFCFDAVRPKPGRGNSWNPDTAKFLEAQMHWLNKKGVHNEPEPVALLLNELGL